MYYILKYNDHQTNIFMIESIRIYLDKYSDIWKNLSENNKPLTIPCIYDPKELFTEQNFIFKDSDSNKYKILKLFNDNTNDVFSCFIIHDQVSLDQNPIYTFSKDEIELVGNFRNYIQKLLNEYTKKYKNLQHLRSAQCDVNFFSKIQVTVSLWLSEDSIIKI